MCQPPPQEAQDEGRQESAPAGLQPRQREAAPADLLAEAVEDDVGDPVREEPKEGELFRVPELAQLGPLPEQEARDHRGGEEQDRRPRYGDEPPPAPDPPAEHAPYQLTNSRRAADQGRHDEGGDHGPEAAD
jgi:hypothetical protein